MFYFFKLKNKINDLEARIKNLESTTISIPGGRIHPRNGDFSKECYKLWELYDGPLLAIGGSIKIDDFMGLNPIAFQAQLHTIAKQKGIALKTSTMRNPQGHVKALIVTRKEKRND